MCLTESTYQLRLATSHIRIWWRWHWRFWNVFILIFVIYSKSAANVISVNKDVSTSNIAHIQYGTHCISFCYLE